MTGDSTSLIGVIFQPLECEAPFQCNREFDQYGIALWLLLMLYMFKALGTICDEYFVPALEVIVEKLDISNDVAGATFMAAGSSAPELFTSLVATFLIQNEAGVGTIVGSAIFNILVIIGITCVIACQDRDLPIWWYPLTRDCAFYSLSVFELVMFLADHQVVLYEGLIMVFTYILYCLYMKLNPRIVSYFNLQPPGHPDVAAIESPEPDAPRAVNTEAPVTSETWEDPVQKVTLKLPCEETEGASGDSTVANTSNLFTPSSSTLASASSTVDVPGTVGAAGAVGAVCACVFLSEDTAKAKALKENDTIKKPVGWSMKRQKTASAEAFNAVLPTSAGSAQSSKRSSLDPDGDSNSDLRTASKTSGSQRSRSKEASPENTLQGRSSSKERADCPGQVPEVSVVLVDTAAGTGGTEVRLPEAPCVAFGPNELNRPEGVGELADQLECAVATHAAQGDCEEEPQGWRRWCRDPLTVLMELVMPSAERHCALLFSLSILLIGFSTYVMVDSTNRIGIILKAPPLFMGLIFLAAGTSIPDAMGSVAVAKQGEGDMAVANSVGSNVFDILVGLGVPWTLRCLMEEKVVFPANADFALDIGILASVLVLLIISLVVNKWCLSRKLGYALLGFYGLYIVYNILAVWAFKIKEVADD